MKNFENYKIIKETNEYILVWKPQGLPTVPIKNSNLPSLINIIVKVRPELKKIRGYKLGEHGLLNRLDNETGGIVIIAKNQNSFEKISYLMKNEKIEKTYLAFCHNNSNKKSGIIDLPIAHHHKNKKKMVIVNHKNKPIRGKLQYSKTIFERISKYQASKIWNYYLDNKIDFPYFNYNSKNFSWILCKIRKGKRHQIRLHLSEIGYPIVNDKFYNKEYKYNIFTNYHILYSIGINFL